MPLRVDSQYRDQLELSKVIPREGYYISGLVPGLLFELMLALANPSLVSGLSCRLQSNPSVGKYGLLAVALFLALVIGNTFMLLVSLIQFLLGVAYRTCTRLKWLFERHALAPALNWWFGLHKTPKKHSQWLGRFYQRLREKMFFPQATPGFLWWWAMEKRLLLRRYGLREEEFTESAPT